jgi:glycosyltransferase involved in cell wall biosynthesis
MWSLSIGGAERAVYQLAVGQREAGSEVGLLIASDPGLYGERLAAEGLHVETLGQRGGLDVRAVARAQRLMRDCDVVHFHVAEPTLMLAAVRSGVPAFYTHRAGAFSYPARRRIRYELTGGVLRRRSWGVVGNTVHAADVAASLFRLPRPSVGTVYNGIDWCLLRASRSPADVDRDLGLPEGAFVLGTTGNLRGWKRVDLALLALSRTRPDIAFVVVGDGPDRPRLETLARTLGLERRVRFVGVQSNVADYLQVLDAFVLPSGPEESFGNSAVEAMGVGLPTIVMADGGGLVEHVDHGATGLIADGVDDLAMWIDRLAADRTFGEAIGARAKHHVRTMYAVDRVVSEYANLYAGRSIQQSAPGNPGNPCRMG